MNQKIQAALNLWGSVVVVLSYRTMGDQIELVWDAGQALYKSLAGGDPNWMEKALDLDYLLYMMESQITHYYGEDYYKALKDALYIVLN